MAPFQLPDSLRIERRRIIKITEKFVKTRLWSPSKHIMHFQFIDHFLGVRFSNLILSWILTSFDVNFQVNTLVFAFSTWFNLHTALKSAVLCIYDSVLHTKFPFVAWWWLTLLIKAVSKLVLVYAVNSFNP
jgi:hypothetical protein